MNSIDQRGATAVEYGVLISGIAAVIVVVIYLFGGAVADRWSGGCDKIVATADEAPGTTTCSNP